MREIEKRTGLTLGAGEATCREGNGTGWESLACLNVILCSQVYWPCIKLLELFGTFFFSANRRALTSASLGAF